MIVPFMISLNEIEFLWLGGKREVKDAENFWILKLKINFNVHRKFNKNFIAKLSSQQPPVKNIIRVRKFASA